VINTSSDALASGFDLDDPQFDPDSHDYTNPTQHEDAGALLGNMVAVNGAQVPNGQQITHGPATVTSCTKANIWLGLKNSDDIGTNFDLLAEVLKNGTVVASGTLSSVPGGGSTFNNAVLRTISLSADASLQHGDTLALRLSVRIAENVSGHSRGTARLWFNDSVADSMLKALVNVNLTSFHLLTGSALGASPGGARSTVDVLVDKAIAGNPFKPFGQWSVVF
jgi:hypothetical protein